MTRRGRFTRCRRCSGSACSRSPAATRTPTIATSCAPSAVQAGRRPGAGELCSQPTMSRLENAPSSSEDFDIFCRSFAAPNPTRAMHATSNSRCSTPSTTPALPPGARLPCRERQPVAVLLRPGKKCSELTRRIRRHWPRTRLTFPGARTTASTNLRPGRQLLHVARRDRREGPGAPRRSPPTPPARGTARAGWSPGWKRRPAASNLAQRRAPPSLRRDLLRPRRRKT